MTDTATQDHLPQDSRDRPRWRRWAGDICLFAVLLATVLGLQWRGGAFEGEFYGGDEAAHYVTGLMVYDYLHQAEFTHPMRYAEDYYLHYPKVAIGHWPPLFYVVQTAHYSIFGVSRASVLLCMALIAAMFGTTVYRLVSAEHGALLGLAMGFLAICLPVVQQSAAMVMSDILLALFAVWATLCYAKYLESGTYRHAAAFGLLASLAILTKANGVLLGLVPPLALMLGGQYRLILRLSFWLPGLLVFALCGPWYVVTRHMIGSGFQPFGLEYSSAAIIQLVQNLALMVGAGLSAVAFLGVGLRLATRERMDQKRAALLALLIATVALHTIVPSSTVSRYLIPAVPAVLLFLADGATWVAERLFSGRLGPLARRVIVAGAVLLAFLLETFDIPVKHWHGYREVAEAILQRPESSQHPVLICTDCPGEGMFISEVAQREQRPRHIILRASKVLSSSDWIGSNYQLTFGSADEMEDWLEDLPVGMVVIDKAEDREHGRLLAAAISGNPQKWTCTGRYGVVREGVSHPGSVEVYRQEGCEGRQLDELKIDMQHSLGRTLRGRDSHSPD